MTSNRVATCMIVKDGAATIGRAVASVRPHVDEVCVYDTGSTDGTLELLAQVAQEPGPPIVVERGEWRDDFADARTRSFAMASSEWALWIDADDELERGRLLRGLLRQVEPHADAVAVQYVYDIASDGTMGVAANRRLVRRQAYRWAGRCHEELTPVEGRSARELVANPWGLRMVHKRLYRLRHDRSYLARNVRILRAEVADPAARPEAWWHLGQSVIGTERQAAYERFLALTVDGPPSGARLRVLRDLGRVEEAAAYRAAWVAASQRGELTGVDAIDPEAIAAADRLFAATTFRDVGRNDTCWCGSGRKAKACCGCGRLAVPLAVRAERAGAIAVA